MHIKKTVKKKPQKHLQLQICEVMQHQQESGRVLDYPIRRQKQMLYYYFFYCKWFTLENPPTAGKVYI